MLDLYCGAGTISLFLAKTAGMVIGAEIVPEAIENAKENAVNNNITNVDFVCAPAEEYLPANADKIRADVIIMDPPRKGSTTSFLDSVMKLKPRKIVYVSCDPATLARDVKLLTKTYAIKAVQPVDMFPQTFHVETVVKMTLGK